MSRSENRMIDSEKLQQILEPLIRRIIREEFSRVTQHQSNAFFLDPAMPIYADMEEIAQRKVSGTIELFSHEEVWDD